MKPITFQRIMNLFLVLAMALALAGFYGCANSADDSTAATADSGELVVGLTDAQGDFINYSVNVASLTLTKANGAVVETLPLTTQVDFAQYTDMTEFVTALTIPSGVYTKASMSLDFQNADIRVEDSSGNGVKVDTIQDEDGNAVTTMDVDVHLEGKNYLAIAPGVPAYLTLDFNLNSSNKVTFNDDGTTTLTVSPVLLADVNPSAPKSHRVRGPLKDVDVDDSSFTVIIRPFFHGLTGSTTRFGKLKVITDSNTVFDIDNQDYTGGEGLTKLSELTPLTAVVVKGQLKLNPYRFNAEEVRAGSSVPGGDMDVVTGNVASRQDNTIKVKGATLIRSDGSIVFNDLVTITLGQDTKVKRQLSMDDYGISDISPGQRIRVFGSLTETGAGNLAMDASQGFAKLLITTLRGGVVSTDTADETSNLVINLQSINNRRLALFDFTGTGIDNDHDADPSTYQINTSTLDLTGISTSIPVKVKGFVNGFGQAPADFYAQTIIDVSAIRSFMNVHWHPPTTNAIESISSQSMTLDLDSSTLFHHVARGRVVENLTSFSQKPVIQPKSETGLYFITLHGTVTAYTSFESFTDVLSGFLEDGYKVNKLFATGFFDDATVTLSADYMAIKLI